MSRPEFYLQSRDAITENLSELAELETRLATAYSRWEELEALRAGTGT
jgi:ATP-binding cassette subfamily F protein uup